MKRINILVIILMSLFLISACSVDKNLEDYEIVYEEIIDGLKIQITSINPLDDIFSTISGSIENTTNNTIEFSHIEIKFYNLDDTYIVTGNVFINESIPASERVEFSINLMRSLANNENKIEFRIVSNEEANNIEIMNSTALVDEVVQITDLNITQVNGVTVLNYTIQNLTDTYFDFILRIQFLNENKDSIGSIMADFKNSDRLSANEIREVKSEFKFDYTATRDVNYFLIQDE